MLTCTTAIVQATAKLLCKLLCQFDKFDIKIHFSVNIIQFTTTKLLQMQVQNDWVAVVFLQNDWVAVVFLY